MESGLAHDEASPAKICEDPSCRATEAPARVLGSLGSKLNSQVVKWTKWTPFIVQLWSKRPDGRRWPPRRMTPVQRQRCQHESVYVCVWIQWRNMIWRLWRDELASIWSYLKKTECILGRLHFSLLGPSSRISDLQEPEPAPACLLESDWHPVCTVCFSCITDPKVLWPGYGHGFLKVLNTYPYLPTKLVSFLKWLWNWDSLLFCAW